MFPLVRGCNPLFTKFIELCSWRAMYSPGNDFSFVGHRTSLKRQLKLHVRFAGAHQTAILRAEISFHPWKHASLVAHTITKKKISRREREGGGSRGRKKTVSCKSRVETCLSLLLLLAGLCIRKYLLLSIIWIEFILLPGEKLFL